MLQVFRFRTRLFILGLDRSFLGFTVLSIKFSLFFCSMFMILTKLL